MRGRLRLVAVTWLGFGLLATAADEVAAGVFGPNALLPDDSPGFLLHSFDNGVQGPDILLGLIPPDPIAPPNPILPTLDLTDPTVAVLHNGSDATGFDLWFGIRLFGVDNPISYPPNPCALMQDQATGFDFAAGSQAFNILGGASPTIGTCSDTTLMGDPAQGFDGFWFLKLSFTFDMDPPFSIQLTGPTTAQERLAFAYVPEPATLVLLAAGLLALAMRSLRPLASRPADTGA